MTVTYYTVVISYVAPEFATAWHPTEPAGPFATLTRGAFATAKEARAWAKENVRRAYKIKKISYVRAA